MGRRMETYLESTGESVHETSKEEQGTALEEAGSVLVEVVKHTTDDERHDKVTDERANGQAGVARQSLPTAPETQLDLLRVRQGVGRLDTLTLGLLGLARGAEGLGIRAVDGVSRLVLFNLGLQRLVVGAVLPRGGKLVRGPGRLALEAGTHNTLQSRRHRGEEVGGGLTGRALEAEIDKVLPGDIGAAKEDLATLVEDDGLVEQVVGGLGRLVDGHAGGVVEQLRLQAQRLAELDGVGRVETSGGVVPALQGSTRQGGLGDGDTLALTARHTSNVLVADARVDGVGNAKHGHDNIAQMGGKGIPAEALGEIPGLPGASRKGEGIAHAQLGEVDVDLGGVDGLTTVVGVHFLGRNACASIQLACRTHNGNTKHVCSSC